MESFQTVVLRHAPSTRRLLIGLGLLTLLALWLGWWRPSPYGVFTLLLMGFVVVQFGTWVRWRRERAVREAPLPQFLKRKLRETYPHLSGKDCELVERGLRQFFFAALRSRRKFVAMPSKAVDAMWHEFILHTRAYRQWCDTSLGWFLHHTPAEVLGPRARGNDGLRRTWYWACRDEAITPRSPLRLPLLFALDAKLAIDGGFHYAANCRDGVSRDKAGLSGAEVYCAGDFADSGFSGDAGGLGSSDYPSSFSSSSSSSTSFDGGSNGFRSDSFSANDFSADELRSDAGSDGGGSSCGGDGGSSCGGGGSSSD